MKAWRLVIVLLVLIALGLMAASVFFNLGPWNYLFRFRSVLHPGQIPTPLPRAKIETPQALNVFGGLIGLYFSGVIMIFLFPNQINYVGKALAQNPAGLTRLFAIGFLTILLLAIVGASSALAVGTFPMVLFISGILFIGIFLGGVALAYRLGRFLLARAGWGNISPLYPLFLGQLLLYSLFNLSFVGIIFLVLIVSLGLGAAIATRFGTGQPWSLKSLSEE
jgi:hypothetical protein